MEIERMRTRLAGAVVAVAALLGTAAPAGALLGDATAPVLRTVVVQKWATDDLAPETVALGLGATLTHSLPVVNGFTARLPEAAIGALASSPGIRAVTPDAAVLPDSTSDPVLRPSVYREAVGAPAAGGPAGAGVTVAIIDTGVTPVADLAGRIVSVNGAPCVNLSSEPGCQDSYGHGTFIAGLVAGNGPVHRGVAPAANVLSVKLAGRSGASTTSDVIEAIGWVLANKDVYGIKVLNLSLRSDSTLSYRVDPLNLAVQRAWSAGITVVVSAGNQGSAAGTIAKPGDDPWVITVGSTDDVATSPVADDVVASFSSRGPTRDGVAKPDVVAPGRSLVSLRSPGSEADALYPVFVDGTYRRGSGTSFSAGVVSGAAAVLHGADATASNNRVKFALAAGAIPVPGAAATDAGAGSIHVTAALNAPAGTANAQLFHPMFAPTAPGTAADFQGSNWQGSNWQGSNWQGKNWQGSNWQGSNWQGSNWQSVATQNANWQGSNWQGSNWQGSNWQGSNWQGSNWQGSNWQGSNWQSGYWS